MSNSFIHTSTFIVGGFKKLSCACIIWSSVERGALGVLSVPLASFLALCAGNATLDTLLTLPFRLFAWSLNGSSFWLSAKWASRLNLISFGYMGDKGIILTSWIAPKWDLCLSLSLACFSGHGDSGESAMWKCGCGESGDSANLKWPCTKGDKMESELYWEPGENGV